MPDNKFWWLETRKWARLVQKTTQNATVAAETLFHAREGSRVEKGLAFLSVFGLAMDTFIPPTYAERNLREAGWRRVAQNNKTVQSLVDLLKLTRAPEVIPLDSAAAAEDTVAHWSKAATVWRDSEGAPRILHLAQGHDHSLWERDPGSVSEAIRQVFWEFHGNSVVMHGVEWESNLGEEETITFLPMRSSGAYVGESLVAVQEAFAKRSEEQCRVVLLVGPTGVGKTTLSCTALGDTATVVKLPAPDNLEIPPAMEMLEILQPDVVLLDDIPLPKGSMSHKLTQLLDDFHDITNLIVCTFMDDSLVSEDQLKPGVFYYPGMRSGRVDEIIFLPPPNEAERSEILQHYGLDEDLAEKVAEQTEGLTGAFLKEIAERVLRRNQLPRSAVRHIRLQAPPAMSRDENPPLDPDDDGLSKPNFVNGPR